jgi:hypothetical protein
MTLQNEARDSLAFQDSVATVEMVSTVAIA